MTDPDDAEDRTWLRATLDPALDAHSPTDRWADLERRADQEPPLVVSLIPHATPRHRRWLLPVAAALVLVAGVVAVLATGGDDGDSTATSATSATTAPPTSGPPSTPAPTPSTAPPTTPPTTEPAAPLVEVPEVRRRIDLASFGLDVRYLDRANPEVAEGAVVSQDPAPGTQVPEGSLVVVIMSGGGPVTTWAEIPPEARRFTDEIPEYRRTEPLRRIPTDAGEAFKTDAWLFGPCPAVEAATPGVLDPSYDIRCY